MHWVAKLLSVLYRFPYVSFVGYTPSISDKPKWSFQLLRERLAIRLFMGDVIFCQLNQVKSLIEPRTDKQVQVVDGILQEAAIRKASDTVEPGKIRNELGITERERFLVYVGRLVPIKNVEGAISILEQLPSSYQLVIIGDGPERGQLENVTNDRELADRIIFTGELCHQKTLEYIAAADSLLLTSTEE